MYKKINFSKAFLAFYNNQENDTDLIYITVQKNAK